MTWRSKGAGSKAADKYITASPTLWHTGIFPASSGSQIFSSQRQIQSFSIEKLLPIMCVHINSFIPWTGLKLVNSCNLCPNKSQKEIWEFGSSWGWSMIYWKVTHWINSMGRVLSFEEFSFRKVRAPVLKVCSNTLSSSQWFWPWQSAEMRTSRWKFFFHFSNGRKGLFLQSSPQLQPCHELAVSLQPSDHKLLLFRLEKKHFVVMTEPNTFPAGNPLDGSFALEDGKQTSQERIMYYETKPSQRHRCDSWSPGGADEWGVCQCGWNKCIQQKLALCCLYPIQVSCGDWP